METAETRNECSQNIEQGNESLLHTADQAEDAIEKNIKTIGDLINNTAEHTMKILSEKESLNATFVLDSVMNILDEMRENNGTILKEMEALKSGVASVKTEVVNVVEQTLAKMNDTFGDIINYVTEYTGKEIAQICNIYNSSKHDYMISILEDLHYCWGDRVCWYMNVWNCHKAKQFVGGLIQKFQDNVYQS